MRPKETAVPDVHLNLNVRGLTESATLAINERSRAMQREGREVSLLGLGQSPFPVPGPVVDELKANAHQKDYLPVKGLERLRDAVAGYHRRQVGGVSEPSPIRGVFAGYSTPWRSSQARRSRPRAHPFSMRQSARLREGFGSSGTCSTADVYFARSQTL